MNPHLPPSLWFGRSARSAPAIGFGRGDAVAPADDGELLRDAGESHLLCFAPTGAGKTRGFVIPNLLQWPGAAVVIDVKQAELCRVTARRRRELGQQVVVLDPFGETEHPPGGLNPLDIFSLPGAACEADAETLAALFAGHGAITKDPFWDAQGTSLLAAVLAHVGSTAPAEKRNLSEVIRYLLCDDVVYNLAVTLDTQGKTMPRSAYREIAALLAMPDVTRGGVLATAQSYLKSLHSPGVLRALDQTSFSLRDFIRGQPMTIYLVVPAERLVSHRALLKVWIGTLLRAIVCRSFRAETPTLMLLDECGQLGAFPFLETFITLCRAYSCRVLAFFQDLAQLEAAYPTSWRTLTNNCGLSAFGFLNRRLAEQWSGFFDTSTAELRAMQADEQIVMLPGRGEQRVRRLDYLRDVEFAEMYDENPLYAAATTGRFEACFTPSSHASEEPNVELPPRRRQGGGGGDGGRAV